MAVSMVAALMVAALMVVAGITAKTIKETAKAPGTRKEFRATDGHR
jgi:hypothetical protein